MVKHRLLPLAALLCLCGASASPAQTKPKGNDVVINGESFFAAANIKDELTRLARADGYIGATESFRQIAVSGAVMTGILNQFKNCTPLFRRNEEQRRQEGHVDALPGSAREQFRQSEDEPGHLQSGSRKDLQSELGPWVPTDRYAARMGGALCTIHNGWNPSCRRGGYGHRRGLLEGDQGQQVFRIDARYEAGGREAAGWFGPELVFGKTLSDSLPGTKIALIKYAVGSTYLAPHWQPPSSWGNAGSHYNAMLATVTSGLAGLVDTMDFATDNTQYKLDGMIALGKGGQ